MIKLATLTVTLFFANVCGVFAQSSLSNVQPDLARELFGAYAGCKTYWKVIRNCVPPNIDLKESAQVQKSFDQLNAIGVAHMDWLATKAELSAGIKQQITDKAISRVLSSGGKCDSAPKLISEYRDKCAALMQNIATAQKQDSLNDEATEVETMDSAAKFVVSVCYEPIDDVSRVTSYARLMKWSALSEDQKNIMRPVNSKFYEAWEVDHDGITYIISINRGQFKGRPTEVCQVSVPLHAQPVVSRVRDAINTRFMGTNNSGVQISDLFELVSHPSIKQAVMMVGRADNNRSFFTIAFMGIK